LLSKNQFNSYGDSARKLIDYGLFSFVNENENLTRLKWSSPLLKEFIIHFAITIKNNMPSAPLMEKKLDYSSLFTLLGKHSEVTSLVKWDQEDLDLEVDPLEAGFYAEFYRVLKGILFSTHWVQIEIVPYSVVYEGRLGTGRRRMDLLLKNDDEKVVVEVKMLRKGRKSPAAVVNDGVIQAHDYAKTIDASRLYLLICTNYDPALQSPISVVQKKEPAKNQEELYDSQYAYYDEQEDSTYDPEKDSQMAIDNSQASTQLPIKIILFQFTPDWCSFLSFVELAVQLSSE